MRFVKLIDRILSIVVIRTKDEGWAERSIFQFKPDGEYGVADEYIVTVLGFINGLLPLLPFHPVLVKKIDDETDEVVGFGIRKKWW